MENPRYRFFIINCRDNTKC